MDDKQRSQKSHSQTSPAAQAQASHSPAFTRRDPEVQRFLKAQPPQPIPRHQLVAPPPPGLVAYQLLPGHRVVKSGD